jgi:hypothetical protein
MPMPSTDRGADMSMGPEFPGRRPGTSVAGPTYLSR